MKVNDIIPLTEAFSRKSLLPRKGFGEIAIKTGPDKENPFDSDTKHYAKKAVGAVKKMFGKKEGKKDVAATA